MNFKALRQPHRGRRIILPKTTILAMKLTAILLLIGFLQVSARGYSQKITLKEQNASQFKVIQDLKSFGFQFFLPDDFSITQKINIDVRDATIDEVLDIILKGQPWTFKVLENIVLIKKKELQTPPQNDNQTKIVTASGTVYNESGQPLAGATITEKKTGREMITDPRGGFAFPNVEVNSILIVTFVGYAPDSIRIKDGSSQIVYLKIAKNDLDRIVVQGYGSTNQRLTTSDISTVSSAEIERQPVVNVLTALQGNVPGLVIQQANGYASSPFKVEIRGRTELDPNRPSEPLYVIDGVPLTVLESGLGGSYSQGSSGFIQNGMNGPAGGQSPLFSLNPSDIESVSVLKDADATSIYGSRGANGVILITTKSGKAGKASFDINAYQGEDVVTQHYQMLNTQQYLQVRHEAFNNDQIVPDQGNAYDLLLWDTTRHTDLQKALWGGIGQTSDIQMALSAGDKQNTFRISGGYHRETDILTVSGANQRASFQTNLTHKSVDQKLSLTLTTNYSYALINIQSFPNLVTLPPDIPTIFSSKGKLNWSGWEPDSNPFGELLQPYSSSTNFLSSRLQIKYNIYKGLAFSTSLGYSTTHDRQSFYFPISSQDPAYSPTGSAYFGSNDNTNAIIEPQLEYKKDIWLGQLNALAGVSYQSVGSNGNQIQGSGYVNDNLIRSISNAPSKSAADDYGQYRYDAGFVRINYNLLDRYIVNFSGRKDGSSRFGPGRQFGTFGALGAAWIFSEEPWLKSINKVLSFGKLRGSYGTTGSDAVGDYSFLSTWSSINNTYIYGSPSYQTTALFNPDLQWQVNKKLEGAIDIGFLKDRILIDLSWYRDRSSNELVNAPLPTQTGFSNVMENLPATIQNMGYEGTLKAKIIDNSKVSWSVSFNMGINRNKLVSFPNLAQSSYNSIYVVGKPLSIARLLHFTGVDPQSGEYTFTDKHHNGQIDANPNDSLNDLFEKNLTVRFDGGFGTSLSYKSIQLDLFFRIRVQTIPTVYAGIGGPGTIENEPVGVLNHWQKPGDKAAFSRYTTQPDLNDYYYYNQSDGVYGNGSYVRLQNVSLSYILPTRITTPLAIKSLKLFARGENVFIITKYKGLDPDTPGFGNMPPAKYFVGGIQLTF